MLFQKKFQVVIFYMVLCVYFNFLVYKKAIKGFIKYKSLSVINNLSWNQQQSS